MTIIRSCHILIFRKYFVENEIYKNKTLNNFFRNSFENLEGVPPPRFEAVEWFISNLFI